MTRTVDATLSDGLTNKTGRFFSRVILGRSGDIETIPFVTGFEIDEGRLTAWVRIPQENQPEEINPQPLNDTVFRIDRGLIIGNTAYLQLSSWYVLNSITEDNKSITYFGHIFKDAHYEAAGDVAASSVISTFLANSYVTGQGYSNTISYPSDVEWWKSAQFMPDGGMFRIGDMRKLNSILGQKYVCNLIDLGGNVLFPIDNGNYNEYEPTDPTIIPLTPCIDFTLTRQSLVNKYFQWRDENGDVNAVGDSTHPRHNLGYIETSVTPFSLREFSAGKVTAKIAPPDLRLTAADYIRVQAPGFVQWDDWYRIKETFDPKAQPPWYQTLESVKILNNTEGGALPEKIATPATYGQINTSEFDGRLSTADTNLQAALETLDEISDVIGTFLGGVTVPASTTYYTCPLKDTANTIQNQFPWADDGTIYNLQIRASTSQPASGSLVCTLQVNGIDTSLVATIPAGSVAGQTYFDKTHKVNINTGAITWKLQNNATSASAALTAISMKLK